MWVATHRMVIISLLKMRNNFLGSCVGGFSVRHLLLIRDGSGYMAGCEVITYLDGNKMKVSTRKGYVSHLIIFNKNI